MKRKIYKLFSGTKQGIYALALMLASVMAYSQNTYSFSYTGSLQTITLQAGNYSVQCWGADGGNATNGTSPMQGGKGGYATGVFTNTLTGIYNVYVGGHGGNASGASNLGGGGGGMSDIAPASNPTMVVIAGGGGGGATSGIASESSTGGGGGGLVGGTALDNTGVSTGTAATGGSQTAGGFAVAGSYGAGNPGGYGYGGGAANGGTLGIMHGAGGTGGNGGTGGWNGGGGGCTSTGGNDHSAGGGAGYYGGGGGRGDGGAGGGGSSYIGGVTNGSTAMFGQAGFVTNPDAAGNGMVIITELCSISLYAANNTNSLSPVICTGQSLTLLTNATSNYSWSTGATSSSLVVAPTTNTVFTLSATSPANCTTSRTISVTVSAGLPALSISNPSSNICLGQSATLTASGALSYTWTNAGVVNGQSFTPQSTASYTVTGENGCGTSSAVTTVSVSPLAVTASSSSSIVCQGYTATLTASSAVSGYTWEPGTLTASLAVVAPTIATIYTVTASDGICSGTQTVLLATKTTPTIVPSTTLASMCLGEVLTLSASGAGTGGIYSWSPGNGSGSSVTVSPSTSTIFAIMGTNSLNCTASAQIPVIVNQPDPLYIAANKTLVCTGDQVTLTASGSNSYSWTNGPGTATNVVSPASGVITYTVTGFNNTNTCTATRTIDIAVLTQSVTYSSSLSICSGASATLTASGANTYTWNGINTASTGVLVTTPMVTTNYVLIANTQSLATSCISSYTATVYVNANPTVSIVASKTTAVCKGTAVTLSATGAQSYSWNTNASTASISVSPSVTTTYIVVGTNSNNCQASSQHVVNVSSCNSLDENTVEILRVYPNPSNGQFFVSSESAVTLKLINALGQVVQVVDLNSQNGLTVGITGLAKGVYYICYQNDSKQSGFTKLVVN